MTFRAIALLLRQGALLGQSQKGDKGDFRISQIRGLKRGLNPFVGRVEKPGGRGDRL